MEMRILFVWSCFIVAGVYSESVPADLDVHILKELENIRDAIRGRQVMTAIQHQLEEHQEAIADHNEIKAELSLLQQRFSELENKLESHIDCDGSQNNDIDQYKPESALKRVDKSVPVARSRFTALGCASDTITFACPNDRNISVTNAVYGKYYISTCANCCPPSPSHDCVELVSENQWSDWGALKHACDNATSCDYQYNGEVMVECQPGYIADYMQIFYDCLPEDTYQAVGFTAHATKTRKYTADEAVVFDDVQSNFGGHYNGQTCSFQCPYHGIYMFSVNFNAYAQYFMYIEIVRDAIVLGTAWAEDHLGGAAETIFNHASALVIVDCEVGQVVWARCNDADSYLVGESKYSQFSGYLLHRYD